jgi:hypothetical protein
MGRKGFDREAYQQGKTFNPVAQDLEQKAPDPSHLMYALLEGYLCIFRITPLLNYGVNLRRKMF